MMPYIDYWSDIAIIAFIIFKDIVRGMVNCITIGTMYATHSF